MLDNFKVKKPGGFPYHPHAGISTFTLMVSGSFEHKDNLGHVGLIEEGGSQWMRAGSGIIHSEMPHGSGFNTGLQLWINMPRKDKGIDSTYKDVGPDVVKEKSEGGVRVRCMAGSSTIGCEEEVFTTSPMKYLDITIDKDVSHWERIPKGWNGFCYILEGSGLFGKNQKKGQAWDTLVLGDDTENERLEFTGLEDEPKLHFVLVSGQPLREPVFHHGPFVSNTREEMAQIIMAYQSGEGPFKRPADDNYV